MTAKVICYIGFLCYNCMERTVYGGGLVQLVATSGPVSTGMGDRIGVQLLVREIYLSLTNHPAWPYLRG